MLKTILRCGHTFTNRFYVRQTDENIFVGKSFIRLEYVGVLTKYNGRIMTP